MRRRVALLLLAAVLLATLAVLGAVATSAPAAANPDQASCFAMVVSNQAPGDVGDSASSNAQDPANRPLGFNVISFTAHLKGSECFD